MGSIAGTENGAHETRQGETLSMLGESDQASWRSHHVWVNVTYLRTGPFPRWLPSKRSARIEESVHPLIWTLGSNPYQISTPEAQYSVPRWSYILMDGQGDTKMASWQGPEPSSGPKGMC